MILSQHRQFVEDDLESKSVTSSLSQLALIFTRQVLNEDSEITENGGIQQAAFIFSKVVEELDLKRRSNL